MTYVSKPEHFSSSSLTVLHVITGLEDGGAERVLSNLCQNDNSARHIVVPLVGGGKYQAELIQSGIEVTPAGFTRGRFSIRAFYKLIRTIRRRKPNIVQTWMPHADLLGGLAGWLASSRAILWGVHHSELRAGDSNTIGRGFIRLLAALSFVVPSRVIFTSSKSRAIYKRYGFCDSKAAIVPSGFNLEAFFPGLERKIWLEGGTLEGGKLVRFGVLGRNHPQKNLTGVVEAFAASKFREGNTRLVMAGEGVDSSAADLVELVAKTGLQDSIALHGATTDVSGFLNSIDYLILGSTHGESFPNVLGEAMACGVPCITSDVGSSAEIVGETGWVFRPGDHQGLTEAIVNAARESLKRRRLRANAGRKRIASTFSLKTMVDSYHRLYIDEYLARAKVG